MENARTSNASSEYEKIEILYESAECKLQNNVPVLIEKVYLLKDAGNGSVFAKCAFRSLTNKTIKALLLDVIAADTWGNPLEGVEGFQLLDLNVKRGFRFGHSEMIPLPNKNTRNVDIIIRKILFEDQSICDCEEAYSTIPAPTTLLSVFGSEEAVECYAEKTVKFAEFVPAVGQQIWRCTCGAINRTGRDSCCGCGTSLSLQLSAYEPEVIISEGKARLEEKARRDRVSAEIEKENKKKKTFLALAAILLVCAIYGTFQYLIPSIRYNAAANDVEKNNYDAAYNTYIALKDYRDSSDKAIETLYQKAAYLEGQKQFAEAATEYEKIPDYQDSKTKAVHCRNEAQYAEAKAKYDAKDYDGAIAAFTKLGRYLDSQNWVLKTKYAKASDYFDNKEYAKAAELFKELKEINDYLDSQERMEESEYQLAEAAYAQKDYQAAYQGYEALGADYKDAGDKAKDAKYLYACECLSAKNYKDASDLFSSLKGYKDGQNKFNEATYAYAKNCLDSLSYSVDSLNKLSRCNDARTYFAKIPGYEDADSLWNEASYNAGIISLGFRAYDSAVDYLEDVKGHSDVKEKIKEAKYEYVKAHTDRTNKTTYSYLKDLKTAGYQDSRAIYNELYAWKMTFTAINNREDSTVNMSSLSKYETWWYFHLKLSGGPPSGTTTVKAVCTLPNGTKSTVLWGKDDKWSDGTTGYCAFAYNDPYYGRAGTAVVKIYDGSGTLIGQDSIRITN